MCEEFESHQDRSGQPDVLMGQSIVLSEIKAEVPFHRQDRVSKFCMDAGFISVVETG